MGKQKDIACLVWAPEQNRTKQFANRLDAQLHTIHYLYYQRPLFAPLKYGPQALKTLLVLSQQKPKVIYVANPPVVAPLVVAFYCWLTGREFVMDTHSPALYSRRWGWTVPLQRVLARHALVNIVDQQRYKDLFESWGSRAIILEKPLARHEAREYAAEPTADTFTVTVVNTFAADEPLEPVLEAARCLPDVCFVVLGDTSLADRKLLHTAPDNVTFTGYLLGDEYWGQLQRSNAVMALTTYPYSLMAGGHDGLSLSKPLILSRQPALTNFFTSGTVFVEHTGESIAQAVRSVQANEHRLIEEARELAESKRQSWRVRFDQLVKLIEASYSSQT